jgi:S-adenosylmethionine:tRNA ribosyltransferase-isomerase
MLGQTRGRLQLGETVTVAGQGGTLELRLEERTALGHFLFRPLQPGGALELLQRFGQPPLPPYIRSGRADGTDVERYQTVFARRPGAVAAPTAGLHFSPQLLERLAQIGVGWVPVTLHVGAGTFQPIQVEDVTQHQVEAEWCELPEATAQAIADCRLRGCRVVAVGTTTVRTLETIAARGPLRPWAGETDLTIRPPFTFRVVDALITNFHLPRSSLLLLVAAFTGWDALRESYRLAIAQGYRFYSYGDAMLIVNDHEPHHPECCH